MHLDPLDELRLVFPNRTANVGPDKQCVESRKDAEHFIRVLCSSELEFGKKQLDNKYKSHLQHRSQGLVSLVTKGSSFTTLT